MKFIITEDEKKQIKSLYEQTKTDVEVKRADLDNIATELLPKNFIKVVNDELIKNTELQSKVNQIYNEELPQNPLTYLQSKGVVPYIFIVPNYAFSPFFLACVVSTVIFYYTGKLFSRRPAPCKAHKKRGRFFCIEALENFHTFNFFENFRVRQVK